MHARITYVMFDLIFGWSKASKCKKLMKKVRRRLNLLKNKRCCIATQLRNDVAQLIKHGHYQTAFDRVGQIYKDECIITVYDLLAHFCEFLSSQLSYIRRTKDCPNDINEAISSLIFASARCGDLPELLRLRKLFSQRYGEQFEARALSLLPGNLVNLQIRENLSINEVSNEVKYKLVEEITTTVLQTGPLTLEFAPKQVSKDTKSQQIEDVDFDHLMADRSITYHVDSESSSSNSTTDKPKEITYLDEIEEIQSSLNDDDNGKDQRVFMFSPSGLFPDAGNPKIINLLNSLIEKLGESMNAKRRSPVSSDDDHRNRKNNGDHEIELFVKPIGELGICNSRAVSMPCKSWKVYGDEDDGVMRSYSFPVQVQPFSSHVHPKLPDYDDLVAKFMALKKERFQNHEMTTD